MSLTIGRLRLTKGLTLEEMLNLTAHCIPIETHDFCAAVKVLIIDIEFLIIYIGCVDVIGGTVRSREFRLSEMIPLWVSIKPNQADVNQPADCLSG